MHAVEALEKYLCVGHQISNTETNSGLSVKRSPVVCHPISIEGRPCVLGSVLSAEMKGRWQGEL